MKVITGCTFVLFGSNVAMLKSVVFVVLISAMFAIAAVNGYKMPECGDKGELDFIEADRRIVFSCRRLGRGSVTWQLKRFDRSHVLVGICKPDGECTAGDTRVYTLNQNDDVSLLTVKAITGNSIGGRLRCIQENANKTDYATCVVNVLSPATTTSTTIPTTSTTTSPTSTTSPTTPAAPNVTPEDESDHWFLLPGRIVAGLTGAATVIVLLLISLGCVACWKKRCVRVCCISTPRSRDRDDANSIYLTPCLRTSGADARLESDHHVSVPPPQPCSLKGLAVFKNTMAGRPSSCPEGLYEYAKNETMNVYVEIP